MNAVTHFAFENQSVRVIDRAGDPWFVAADVCRVLGIGNPAMATARLDDDEIADINISDTSSNGVLQHREMTIISESGLYTLVLRSHGAVTPGSVAHRFRKWVTNEVLPCIRRTGRYEASMPCSVPQPEPGLDKFSPEMRTAVAMIAECRRIHGVAAARALWSELGMPVATPAGRMAEEEATLFQKNAEFVFSMIRRTNVISRTDLMRKMNCRFDAKTLSALLQALIDAEKITVVMASTTSRGGRPATLYRALA